MLACFCWCLLFTRHHGVFDCWIGIYIENSKLFEGECEVEGEESLLFIELENIGNSKLFEGECELEREESLLFCELENTENSKLL